MRNDAIKVGKEYAIARYRRSPYHLENAVCGVAETEISEGYWRVKLSNPVIITPSGSWRIVDERGPLSLYNETFSDTIEVYSHNFVAPWEKHLRERQKAKLKAEEDSRIVELERNESIRIQKELPEVLLEIGCTSLAEDQDTKIYETWVSRRKNSRTICIMLPINDAATLLYKLQSKAEQKREDVTSSGGALNSLLQKD